MKNFNLSWFFLSEKSFNYNLKMKITTLLLLVSLFKVQANVYSQNTKITLELNNVSVKEVFDKIKKLTKFKFLYNHSEINIDRRVSVKADKEDVIKILKLLFTETQSSFVVQNNKIIFKKGVKNTIPDTVKKENKTVTGIIKDAEGPLPSASIIVEGTSIGTQSDFDGNYTISVPDTATTLVVSYIGYKTQKVLINNRTNIDILLEADTDQLDEIVLIGYGSVAKKDLTGAVSVVDNIGERPVTSAAEGLQGSVSGVTVTSNGGDPTAIANIQIRGLGTINN